MVLILLGSCQVNDNSIQPTPDKSVVKTQNNEIKDKIAAKVARNLALNLGGEGVYQSQGF